LVGEIVLPLEVADLTDHKVDRSVQHGRSKQEQTALDQVHTVEVEYIIKWKGLLADHEVAKRDPHGILTGKFTVKVNEEELECRAQESDPNQGV
jgi:hypothetical protein